MWPFTSYNKTKIGFVTKIPNNFSWHKKTCRNSGRLISYSDLVLRLIAVFERYRHVEYQMTRLGVLGISAEVSGP